MLRWHDRLAQLNPVHRAPIVALVHSDDEIVEYSSRSVLLGGEQGALASAPVGTSAAAKNVAARGEHRKRGCASVDGAFPMGEDQRAGADEEVEADEAANRERARRQRRGSHEAHA